METSHALFGVCSNLYYSSLAALGVGKVLEMLLFFHLGVSRELVVVAVIVNTMLVFVNREGSGDAHAIDLALRQEGLKASDSETRNLIKDVLVGCLDDGGIGCRHNSI